jgi:hypothetical protein
VVRRLRCSSLSLAFDVLFFELAAAVEAATFPATVFLGVLSLPCLLPVVVLLGTFSSFSKLSSTIEVLALAFAAAAAAAAASITVSLTTVLLFSVDTDSSVSSSLVVFETVALALLDALRVIL